MNVHEDTRGQRREDLEEHSVDIPPDLNRVRGIDKEDVTLPECIELLLGNIGGADGVERVHAVDSPFNEPAGKWIEGDIAAGLPLGRVLLACRRDDQGREAGPQLDDATGLLAPDQRMQDLALDGSVQWDFPRKTPAAP